MSEVLEKKWYVVRAVSGQENKIKGYIVKDTALEIIWKMFLCLPKR